MSTQTSGKKLLTEMRDLMRRLHYSIHTERAYCDWVSRFIRFHQLESRDALRKSKIGVSGKSGSGLAVMQYPVYG